MEGWICCFHSNDKGSASLHPEKKHRIFKFFSCYHHWEAEAMKHLIFVAVLFSTFLLSCDSRSDLDKPLTEREQSIQLLDGQSQEVTKEGEDDKPCRQRIDIGEMPDSFIGKAVASAFGKLRIPVECGCENHSR